VKVLVLGASGSVGRYVAAEVARDPKVQSILVASRRARTAERTARLLGGPSDRVRPVTVDVTDGTAALEAFAAADVVVSAAGPAYMTEVPTIALAAKAGTPYVSLADDHAVTTEILASNAEVAASGTTVISGCGLAPGLSDLFVALGASALETVEEIDIAIARSSAESDGDATAMHFLYELTHPAPVISQHRRSEERAGTSPRLVYFPEPVGWIETFRCGHPEIETLPRRFSDLQSLQFRVGLTEKAAMDVARAAATTGIVRSETARKAFVKASNPLRPVIERMPPRGPAWTALRVDVRGRNGGRQDTLSYGAVDHLRNFASVPIGLLAPRLASGDIDAPGIRALDEVVRPKDFLADMGKRGVRVARLEPVRV
jgi:saccharopine dehydrogenase-like NADP-dependent oxidoreductase